MINISCPFCNRSDFESIISSKNNEQIVKCHCGVIYKNVIIPNKITKRYKNQKIWNRPFFENRYKKISKYLYKKFNNTEMEILDIGCGNGRMLELLHKHFSKSTFYGIEPSLPLHQYILDKSFKIHLIKSNFDDCVLNRTFDLIICMGVDYLFLDHNKAMLKILQMMKPFGGLYIERNVFLEMKSFVGSKINSKEKLFWGNVLINTWFTEKQMEAQLEKYFEIKDKLIYGEECSKQVGWLCISKNNTNR